MVRNRTCRSAVFRTAKVCQYRRLSVWLCTILHAEFFFGILQIIDEEKSAPRCPVCKMDSASVVEKRIWICSSTSGNVLCCIRIRS